LTRNSAADRAGDDGEGLAIVDEKRLRDYLARMTGELREARRRLRELEQAVPEPIAIVGMACRYPGGIASPADLWHLVSAGGDAISPFPDNRGWPLDDDHDGREFRREGGFLHDADLFDAAFFGINPREALAMNPQQRLVLETSWEAVEHAGIDPTTLCGSRTGVFVGALGDGYGAEPGAVPEIEGYQLTGTAGSVASGRVAYTLGLEGPAVTIDTACSSSLVALHLATTALRRDECSLALAGGVTVMSRPDPFMEMARQGALASDARCKAFADAADGMSMAEGVGMLLVQRLSDARREGRRVLAVIRGSAVNQDGASSGLTAPNGPAQQQVILRALDDARLSPADIDAVEAHGTGTSLGDPIEAQALLATYGRDRPGDRPLWLGSFKSNVGHTAGAAGVGGVIKTVLALRHGVLPATLHVNAPTSQVDWESGAVRLLTEARPWPDTAGPRRAGVSSFGISGTNAHTILEHDPATDGPGQAGPSASAEGGPALCVISGRGEAALRDQADRLRATLADCPDLLPGEVATALATTRTGFEYRAAIVADDRETLLRGLSAVVEGSDVPGVMRGQAMDRGKVVFVFPGHGAQRPGMARELLDTAPVFAARMAECAAALSSFVDWSPIDVLRGVEGAPTVDRVDVAQPVLFSVMVSLAALWRSCGIEPDAVVGHSQGEVAAACVSGALSLEDAMRVIVLRSRALGRRSGRGAMATVALPAEQVVDLMWRWADRLEIAVVNSPRSCVVAGEQEALDEFLSVMETDGVRVRRIPGAIAMHTRQVDALREDLLRELAPIVPVATELTYVSTVTGERLDTGGLDAGYWCRNLREPVRFDRAAQNLIDGGHRVFVEMSPHPVLTVPLQEILDAAGVTDAVLAGSLRRDDDGLGRFLTSVGEVVTQGVPVDSALGAVGRPSRHVDLPTYPFQRERFWLSAPDSNPGDMRHAGLRGTDHPLLGAVVSLADGGLVLTGRLAAAEPDTALVDLAVHAGDHVGCGVLDRLELRTPLSSSARGSRSLQVVVGPAGESDDRRVDVYSRPARDDESGEWTHHATGTVRRAGDATEPGGLTGAWPPDGAVAGAGPDDVPVWRRGPEHYVEAGLGAAGDTDVVRYGLHPALLADVLHAVAPAGGVPRRGTEWRSVTLHATGASAVRARLTELGGDRYELLVADVDGRPVLSAGSVTLSPVPGGHATEDQGDHPLRDSMFQVRWRAGTTAAQETPTSARVIGRAEDLADLSPVPQVVAYVVSPETAPLADAARETTVRALAVLRTWLGDDRFLGATLVVVTRGAVAVGDEDMRDLSSAPLWGLLRTAQLEHPDRFVLLDLETGDDVQALVTSVAGLGEPQVALRGNVVHVPRLARVEPTPTDPPGLDPEGTVLITGGTGTVAGLVARHLVAERGVRHLLLTSRRGLAAPGAEELRAELTGLGARVSVVACDLADRAEVDALVAGIPTDHPLTNVVHAAAVVDDAVIETLTPEQIAAVFAPKVDAVLNLHEATLHLDLAGFLLFSGAAGTLGNAGQGGYAAANVFLDAFAQHRRALGLPAVSLAWGLWAERSAAVRLLSDARLATMSRGSAEITTDHGMALLDAARALDLATLVPLPLNPAVLRASALAGELPALLRDLVTTPVRRAAARVTGARVPDQRWADMPAAERDEALLTLVLTSAATTLGHTGASGAVRTGRAFRDLGFDSLTAVELRNRLSTATGLRLPAGLVFDHPTPEAVAGYLGTMLSGTASRPTTADSSRQVAAPDDPVAIVSMGCRWPGGVTTPEDLWRLLRDGVDALTDFPADRGWDVDRVYGPATDAGAPRIGGFLDDAAGFDAHFFGIGPHEATAMDPQQRVLLEATWEALERAGIEPSSLRGSQTGVFVGLSPHGYGVTAEDVPPDVAVHLLTGTTASVASGRVSYVLGLEGPAVTVDTACSSALVAVHLAAQSLRQGECGLALAAGVAVMATPAAFSSFSGQHGLASDGRVKAFAASADGTGWGEGVGVFLLERLSDARRNGHPVLALVRGGAMNQDGASNGLTAPNGPAQERVIHQALKVSGLTPGEVDAVEAHGTGTRLGDPIEAHALISAYGREHAPDRPLWLGSVKSNIGHTQAAAGAAGLMKMVLALRHSWLPATLHVDRPTPEVDWGDGTVRLLTEGRPWPATGAPRRAGVSSFGISGTNAHLILEQAPPLPAAPSPSPRGPVALPLSGRTEAAVREQARLLLEHLAADGGRSTAPDLARIGHTLATTRTTWEHRAVVVGADHADVRAALAAVADGSPGTVRRAASTPGRIAFLFSGQGSQRPDMGLELAASYPVFADALADVCAELDRRLPRPLREVLAGDPESLAGTEFAQPALFAVEVALCHLLDSWGLRPDLLLGHSVGELAAAHVSGLFPLAEACELVAARGRLMQRLPAGGAMVACQASEAEVAALLAQHAPEVAIAAVNSPLSIVIAGEEGRVLDIAAALAARGHRTKRLAVSHAFHSAMLDPMLGEFHQIAAGLRYDSPTIPLVSARTGRHATAEELRSPDYWVDQARGTVRFHDGVRRLVDDGVTTFVEIGPGGVLTAAAQECVADGSSFLFVPVLRAGRPEARSALSAVAEAHAHGVAVDWTAVLGAHKPVTDLPTYPFQRRRFWLAPKRPAATSALYGVRWSTVDIPSNRPVAAVSVLGQQHVGVAGLREAIRDGAPAPDAVLARLSGGALPHQALTLVREWLAADLPPACRLVVATTSAVARGAGERIADQHAASVWGLVRSAQWEHPGRFVLFDDDGTGGGTDDPGLLSDALATGEPQLAVRDGALLVPRLDRVGDPAGATRWDPEGTVLITGGSGRLAPLIARHLVTAHGVCRLLMVSRRGTVDGLADLAGHGVTVDGVACDITDRDALAAVLAAIPAEHPLTGIVHLASVADHGLLDTLTADRLATVLRPATVGARNLHELTEHLPLSAFVLFSSVAGTTGAIGHAAQGAAAAYLDALAHDRRARGLAGTALAWGPWQAAAGGQHRGATELRALSTAEALALFDAGTAASRAALLPLDLDLDAAGNGVGGEPVPHLLRGLVRPASRTGSETPQNMAGATWFAGTSASERRAALLDIVRSQAASVLGYGDAGLIADDRAFLEQGFDSLTGVELRNRLAAATGLTLPATTVFDLPSPAALAGHLADELGRHTGGGGGEGDRRADHMDSLLSLFREAVVSGRGSLCDDLLVAASRLRAGFGREEAADHAIPVVRLASGPARPRLICLPAVAATAGPQQYARFAAEFRSRRDVVVLPNPGFVDGEPLPDSVETLVELHADRVRAEMAEHGPVVLVGHSAGGLIAHAVATHLEQTGHAPPGLVLVDTSWPGEMQEEAGAALLTEMLKREGTLHHVLTATRLTAMGGYGRLLTSWTPAGTGVPTLLVRATRSMPGTGSAVMPRVVWKLGHSTEDVDGDHFTVMEDAAGQTARAVEKWLDAIG
jgi:acyl transferase domain-containing protein/short-subunit dehydrogenase/acyl carrier protein